MVFWIMALAGGAVLAPCIILPPLFEYRAQLELNQQAEVRNAELRERLTAVAKQIEYIAADSAYVERLAREEFGITPPGVETILVEPAKDPAAGDDEATAVVDDGPLPGVSETARRLVSDYPLARVFVLPETRPIVIAFGAILMLAAVVLLGNAASAHAKRVAPRS